MAKKKEFQGANKYERFVIKVVDRSSISEAYYNPRRISDEARKALKSFLQDPERGGQLEPLSWNERTGNLIGGHQRLSILDQLHGGKPYKLTVAASDMDEAEEVRANIFLNNSSAQGEWDVQKLNEIKIEFPEVDFLDCGFLAEDLQVFSFDSGFSLFEENENEQRKDMSRTTEGYRDEKQKTREKKKEQNENGDGLISRGDFSFMVIFQTAEEKRSFLGSLGFSESASRIHGDELSGAMAKK